MNTIVPDNIKALDILSDGVKVGEVPDSLPEYFEDDGECIAFLKELKNLLGLPAKYSQTIDNCVAVLTEKLDEEVQFGPVEILQLAELAFRYPHHGTKIMSAVHYLSNSVEFFGELPEGIYAQLGGIYALLGSLPNKPVNDGDEDADLDDDEEFGYNFEEDSDHSDDTVDAADADDKDDQ